jgi:ABC-type multidrug transport system ATPase subunit
VPHPPTNPSLHCHGLRREDAGVVRIDGVTLEVRAGELVALVGPNGGGKSTLLYLLAGLLRPTSGEARVGDAPVRAAAAAGRIGLLTARPGLYPLLTGQENLAFFGALCGIGRAALADRLARLPPELRAAECLDRPAAVLSSGQAQKLGLARALLLAPDVLLLDEPTANLDPVAARAMAARIRTQADAGRAVVWVCHDLPLVEALADRALVLRRTVLEEVVFDGPRALPEPGRLHAAYAAATPAPAAHLPGSVGVPGGGGGRLAALVRKELTEHRRQPGMLLAMSGVLAGIAGLCLGILGLLQVVAGDAEGAERLAGNLRFFGLGMHDPVGQTADGVAQALGLLGLTQALGMAAVLAGQGVLQDREVGALPFLSLSPLRRWELVLGKALAATLTPWALYLAIVGGASVLARLLPVAAPAAVRLPPAPGWLAGALLSGPAWALAVAALGVVLSVRARDARGAQQGVWAVVFVVVLGLAGALGLASLAGPLVHVGLSGLGLLVCAGAVAAGAALLARDLPR